MPHEGEEAGTSSAKQQPQDAEEARNSPPKSIRPARSTKRETSAHKGMFVTIDQSFMLTKSQLERPSGIDATHLYNGQPTQFTDLQSEEIKLDPKKAAMLKRSNFLPYDGVLYEINDAQIEQEALWTFNGKTHLTHNEYLREVREYQRLKLQHIVVKQNITKTRDYSKSPYRPLTDFFPALARKGPGRLRLRIPPTLILEGTDRALYFTEEQSGYIRRVAGDYCDDTIIAKMLLPSMKDPVAMGAPTLLIKRMSDGGNDCQLINPRMLTNVLRDSVDGALLVQKYIKPRGPCDAMYRTTWKRSSAPSTVLVTGQKIPLAPESNEGRFAAVPVKDADATSNILSFRGGGAIITHKIASEIVEFVEHGNSRFVHVSVFVEGEPPLD